MKKIIKKLSLLTVMVTPIALSPVFLATSCSISQKKYFFMNKQFDSKDELDAEIINNTKVINQENVHNDSWTISDANNNIKTYNSAVNMRDDLVNKIIDVKASISLSKYNEIKNHNYFGSSNELLDKDFNKFSIDDNKQITIYKDSNNGFTFDGKDNTYSGEDLAKLSYLKENEVYYFNDIYFPNKSSLSLYLEKIYFAENGEGLKNGLKSKNVLTAPNGNISSAIKTDRSNETEIKSFIKSNANRVVEVINSDNSKKYINVNDFYNLEKHIDSSKVPYYQYSENKNNSYIIDTRFDDPANFYGAYFYQGSAAIEDIVNTDSWEKIKSKEKVNVKKYSVYQYISSMFSLFANDTSIFMSIANSSNESTPLFTLSNGNEKIQEFENSLNKLDEKFLSYIKTNINNISKGKRYNSFFKIPIAFSLAKEYIFDNSLPSSFLDVFSDYLIFVCDQITEFFKVYFPKNVVKRFSNSIEYPENFDLKTIYGLDNRSSDYSGDMYIFIDKLIEHYPKIILALSTFYSGYMNGLLFSQLLNFSNNTVNQIHDLLKEQYPQSYQLENIDYSEFKLIYQRASATNLKELFDTYNKISTDFNKLFIYSNVFISKLNYINNEINDIYTNRDKNDEYQIKFYKLMDYFKNKHTVSFYKLKENGTSTHPLYKYQYFDSLSLVSTYWDLPTYKEFLKTFLSAKRGREINVQNITEFEKYNGGNGLLKSTYKKLLQIDGDYDFDKLNSYFELSKMLSETNNNITPLFELTSNYNNEMFSKNNQNHFFKVYDNQIKNTEKYAIDSQSKKQAYDTWDNVILPSMQIFTNVLGVIPATKDLSSILSLGLSCIDFLVKALKVEYIQSFYKYKPESNDQSFMWDGGIDKSSFFGLSQSKVQDISDMKLIQPLKYSSSRFNSKYYLNNKLYNLEDFNTLKNDYLETIIYNNTVSKNVNVKYTFDNVLKDKPVDSVAYSSSTLEELSELIYKDAINGTSKYTTENIYKFHDGYYTKNESSAIKKAIQDILNDIKPSKVSMIPKIDNNGYVINNSQEYIIPGKSYDSEKNVVLTPNDKNIENVEYIITHNYSKDIGNQLDNHRKTFLDKIKIHSKKVLLNDIFFKQNYDEIDDSIIDVYLYKANGINGDVKYFISKEQAFNWLYKNYNVKVNKYIEKQKKYQLYDMTFNSYKEYLDFLEENIVEI